MRFDKWRLAATAVLVAGVLIPQATASAAPSQDGDGSSVRQGNDVVLHFNGPVPESRASAAAAGQGFILEWPGSTNLGGFEVDLTAGGDTTTLRPRLQGSIDEVRGTTDVARTPGVDAGMVLTLLPTDVPYALWNFDSDIGRILVSALNNGDSPCQPPPGFTVLGCTVPEYASATSGEVILVGAQVWIDPSAFSDPETLRGTMTHELGHALGLAHYPSDTPTDPPSQDSYYNGELQLMYPSAEPGLFAFHSGDIRGLRALDPPEARFVRSAYEDFLGRSADLDGFYYWSGALKAKEASRTDVSLGLAGTPEWIGKIIDDFYVKTLGRSADAAGKAYWVGRIRSGLPVAEVAAAFYGSNEYFSRYGHNDVGTWVDDLYMKLLHRSDSGDPGGRAYWINRTNVVGRNAVALAFYQSDESRRVRVDGLYMELLDRSPDPGGATYWAGRILTDGDLALAANLAGSSEYYGYAQAYENP